MARSKRKPASTSSQPKFGSPAWFKKYPKAARVAGKMKSGKRKR